MVTSGHDPIVYVVDGDLQEREALRDLVQSVGLRCQGFDSAAAFMSAKVTDEVSCLVLDVQPPGADGLELQTKLIQEQPNVQIIIVCAGADIRIAVNAIKGGAADFFAKPFRDQDLLDAVHQALLRARACHEAEMKLRKLLELYAVLSQREKEVMKLVCAGLLNKTIAAKLGLSEITVKVHRQKVMKKLKVSSIPALVRMADAIEATRRRKRVKPWRGRRPSIPLR